VSCPASLTVSLQGSSRWCAVGHSCAAWKRDTAPPDDSFTLRRCGMLLLLCSSAAVRMMVLPLSTSLNLSAGMLRVVAACWCSCSTCAEGKGGFGAQARRTPCACSPTHIHRGLGELQLVHSTCHSAELDLDSHYFGSAAALICC
jgi:hypothetical protein